MKRQEVADLLRSFAETECDEKRAHAYHEAAQLLDRDEREIRSRDSEISLLQSEVGIKQKVLEGERARAEAAETCNLRMSQQIGRALFVMSRGPGGARIAFDEGSLIYGIDQLCIRLHEVEAMYQQRDAEAGAWQQTATDLYNKNPPSEPSMAAGLKLMQEHMRQRDQLKQELDVTKARAEKAERDALIAREVGKRWATLFSRCAVAYGFKGDPDLIPDAELKDSLADFRDRLPMICAFVRVGRQEVEFDRLRKEYEAASARLSDELTSARKEITKEQEARALLAEHYADKIKALGLDNVVTREQFDECHEALRTTERERDAERARANKAEQEKNSVVERILKLANLFNRWHCQLLPALQVAQLLAQLCHLGLQVPAPRTGKRTTEALGIYANDIENVNRYVLRLLDPLAGFRCEKEDTKAAKDELAETAWAALAESGEWLAARRKDGWK